MAIATDISEPSRMFGWPVPLRDLCLAFAISVFVFATYALAGFPTLADATGDSDSLMRLVEVRDLLGGQAWYDLHQYRMGPEGGFVMHWSRLIDAPLAALMLLAQALGFSGPLSENIALTLWPLILMTGTLFGLLQLARGLGNEHTVFPAAALGAAAIYFVGIYRPGSIDHHNAQIGLTVAMLAFLVNAPGHRHFPALAGICAALMLAIGMETAPYVAVGGAAVAFAFLFGGEEEAKRAAAFALSFAAATFAAFLVTVGPANWSVPACDAMSNVQLSLAAFGGIGLALAALTPGLNLTFGRRLVSLGALGVAFLAAVRYGFPHCLADPYAAVDPRLRDIWLDNISEVQSVFALARRNWTHLLTYYVTPVLALALLAVLVRRDGATRGRLIYGGFLFAAFLVSCWQVRGSSFAVPLATVALSLGIGTLRQRIAANPSPLGSLALVPAWLLSVNIVWSATAGLLSPPPKPVAQAAGQTGGEAVGDLCWADASFARMAALPAGNVLAVSDLGSPILANTPHRVLAGSYHRNIEGNRAMADAMLGKADAAEVVARAQGVDYVALCRANVESRNYAALEPGGFMADLMAGRPPAWLSLDPATKGQAIEIYRVVSKPAG